MDLEIRISKALKFFALLLFVKFWFPIAYSQPYMSEFHRETLAKDHPIKNIQIKPNGNIIFQGNYHLWIYKPSHAKLLKISSKNLNSTLHPYWVTLDKSIYFSNKSGIYKLDLDSELVESVGQLPAGESAANTVGFTVNGKTLFWATEKSIFAIDLEQNITEFYAKNLFLLPTDKFNIDAQNHVVFLARDRYLLTFDPFDPEQSLKVLQKTQKKILGVNYLQDHVVLVTAEALLNYDPSGNLVQAVTVNNGRRLAAWNFSADFHTFIFEDGTTEIYDVQTPNKKMVPRYLPARSIKANTALATDGKILVVARDSQLEFIEVATSLTASSSIPSEFEHAIR